VLFLYVWRENYGNKANAENGTESYSYRKTVCKKEQPEFIKNSGELF
jgi:hypothetical protein